MGRRGHTEDDDQHLVGRVQQGEQGLVGADLRAAGGQQQIGHIRRLIQALAEQQGHQDLVGYEQEFRKADDGPRQTGQRKVEAGEDRHPFQRAFQAPQQDGGGGKMPCAPPQGGADLLAQQQGDQRPGKEDRQCADTACRQRQPALQQEGPQLETEVTNGKNHGKTPRKKYFTPQYTIKCAERATETGA